MKLQVVFTTFIICSTVIAMPPAPGLVEMLHEHGQLVNLVELHKDARNKGVNEPFEFHLDQLRRDDVDEIELHAVCILVDFDDNEANPDNYPADHFQEMLFSVDEYATGSVRDWYLENSNGELHITGQVYGWYRMPQDYAWYVAGEQGRGDYPRNARGLVRDALEEADEDIDYSEFDNDDNGVVEALFVVHAGLGAEETGSHDMIWSHSWSVPNVRHDGMDFDRYAMEPENGRIGVFGHELGHSLFGLPDLYDRTYESAGIGVWSMMSAGVWGGGGDTPVHFDAWCKQRIGFVEPVPIAENMEDISQEPVEEGGNVYIVWQHGEWGDEYFLLENRQSIGFDRSIPGPGLLIWHIDEAMRDNDNPWWPGGGGNSHYKVALEQADGDYDLEHDNNNGDSADPWPGSSWNTMFARNTEPNSRDYEDNDTEVIVYDIEPIESTLITYSVGVYDGVGPEAIELFLLERIPEDHRYPDPDNDEVTIDEVSLVTGLLEDIWVELDGHDSTLPDNLDDFNAVLYLESWRDGEEAQDGLSQDEQLRLVEFLEAGNKLMLIGPDVATNLQGDDNPLWDYLMAEYSGEGNPSDEGNLRIVSAAEDTRISGMRFPFIYNGSCDHYVDIVGPAEGAYNLFLDQSNEPRGIVVFGETGYRLILQPFLFGGLLDWGSSKTRLISLYLQQLRFYLSAPEEQLTSELPASLSLLKAWPNPFNSALNISFISCSGDLKLIVYDVAGRRIGNLEINSSTDVLTWMPHGLQSGSYWIVAKDLRGCSPVRVTYLK